MKLRIKEIDLDTSQLKILFLHLKDLKTTFNKSKKMYKKDHPLLNILQEEITDTAYKIGNFNYKKYSVSIQDKKGHKVTEVFYDRYPKVKELKKLKDSLKEVKQKERLLRKFFVEEEREYLGLKYKTIGGTFFNKETIKTLQPLNKPELKIMKSKKPHNSIKVKHIGIELELINKLSREDFNKKLIKEGLASYVYVKDDSSIQREEDNDRQHEVTILCNEFNYVNILSKVCATLKEVNSYVNNSCGMHVHIDCRNRDYKKVYNNLVKALPLLCEMVPINRSKGSHAERYCSLNKDSNFDTTNKSRYQAINPDAMDKFKTIEIRLHSGTTNAAKIINWVKILSDVSDYDFLNTHIKTVEDYKMLFPNAPQKLISYMQERISLFREKKNGADTRSDHFWADNYQVAI